MIFDSPWIQRYNIQLGQADDYGLDTEVSQLFIASYKFCKTSVVHSRLEQKGRNEANSRRMQLDDDVATASSDRSGDASASTIAALDSGDELIEEQVDAEMSDWATMTATAKEAAAAPVALLAGTEEDQRSKSYAADRPYKETAIGWKGAQK